MLNATRSIMRIFDPIKGKAKCLVLINGTLTVCDVWDDIDAAWDGIMDRSTCSGNCSCEPSKCANSCDSVGSDEPKNNDGRDSCYWCRGPVKQVMGLNESYGVCCECGR